MNRSVTITIQGIGQHFVTFHGVAGWRPYFTDNFSHAVEAALLALRFQEGATDDE